MKICVLGLWHLGCTVSACLAKLGHDVTGLDFNEKNIADLNNGNAPLFEPGLDDLIKENIRNKKLSFTTKPDIVVKSCDVLWVTIDTPVDSNDNADVDYVEKQILSVIKYLKDKAIVIISSQVPVGFTRKIKEKYLKLHTKKSLYFGYSPENLRLGKAIKIFFEPDRIIIGVDIKEKIFLEPLFLSISKKNEWMSIESSEMTKHAINAFLAASVSFANEIASICESVGANAKEVEKGLKTEERIGPKAYLKAGTAFSGGTLARDIKFLSSVADKYKLPLYLIKSVKKSNDNHKNWVKKKCIECLKKLKNKKIAVLGLTYKPNTNTLRRSLSVELCKWLIKQGAQVMVFDPSIKTLPTDLSKIKICKGIKDAVKNSNCIIIATEWPGFLNIGKDLIDINTKKNIIDPNGFLQKQISMIKNIKYYSVGETYAIK